MLLVLYRQTDRQTYKQKKRSKRRKRDWQSLVRNKKFNITGMGSLYRYRYRRYRERMLRHCRQTRCDAASRRSR